MNPTPQKGGHISQAWLVILLAMLYGGSLAGVQTALGPIIAKNKRDETLDKVPRLVDGAAREITVEVELTDADGNRQTVYRAFADDDENTHKGWILPAAGQGFAGRIEVLIGLNPDASVITGLYVLDQKETPGLGNFITDDELFLDQFAGKSADHPLEVAKTGPISGNQIQALTGATISSDSVATIVNRAIAAYQELLRRETAAGAPAKD